jgi:hypothetical protein
MKITYKLVGIPVKSSTKIEMLHKDWDSSKTEIKISDVQTYFTSLGVDKTDTIKFITDSETMKAEKLYTLTNDRQIFVFTMEQDLKSKLTQIFQEHGYETEKKTHGDSKVSTQKVDETLSKPIPLDEIKIDESVINESNQETIKLFHEEDFNTLLRIYSRNAEMFKRFSAYISSGDVVLPEDRFEVPEDVNYQSHLKLIKDLGIESLDDEVIMTALQKFKGHLNLTLRYILFHRSEAEI